MRTSKSRLRGNFAIVSDTYFLKYPNTSAEEQHLPVYKNHKGEYRSTYNTESILNRLNIQSLIVLSWKG